MGEGNERNQLCECGSGKKRKKCCKDKKPRIQSVNMDMENPIAITSYELTSNGELKLFVDGQEVTPKMANLNISLDRPNKKIKQTLKINQNPMNLQTDLNALLHDYDFIYAVDTNTSNSLINDEYFSVGVALEYKNYKKQELQFQSSFTIQLNHKEKHLAEKLGIIELIKKIIIDKSLETNDLKILLVTDHDLGNIDRYNSREIPMIEETDLYLPKNFTLVYASADKKNDSILNSMISQCDQEASRILKETMR
ncbi:hypothetical protein ACIOBL_17970 [Paenibacillus taichungensis]|uniref:hypothetical protein n=1 Tax=Paenibacillus TaxID=44249 RepID=UPI0022A97B63|nr:hypothetical protein [Paenibacillus tundrae]MCZ1265966.1 hypothetical protein [Paenibacillus tundrae]